MQTKEVQTELVMRKVIALEFITLDGVIQAGGGPEEDTSGGFAYGGWAAPYSDDVIGTVMNRQMNLPFDLLLGRKTFEIWAPYWSQHADRWQGVNTATKYVASNTMTSHEWQPSVFLSGDIAERVRELKQQPGPDLHVYGSANLLQTLMKHDLVDAFWLKIYPLTLGNGKRLFTDGTIPAAFKVTDSQVSPNGIIIVNYERAGAVKTGSFE
jgi:dihydrofolate reductase